MTADRHTRRSILRGLVLGCLWSGIVVAGPAQGPAARPSPQTHAVTLNSFAFQPESLTVRRGDTVVWTNKDMVPHTVTDVGGAFDSGNMAPGKSWMLVTKKAGTYHYVCTLHPNMKATLIVK